MLIKLGQTWKYVRQSKPRELSPHLLTHLHPTHSSVSLSLLTINAREMIEAFSPIVQRLPGMCFRGADVCGQLGCDHTQHSLQN